MQKILSKEKLNSFIENLIKNYDVIAPIKEGNTKFKIIKSPKEIYLKTITEVPAKDFFIPENEILFEYKKGKIIENVTNLKQRIIFGLRLCDLNALQVLDNVMKDPLYMNKRKNTILIGLFCEHPDKFCFCNSMELNENCFDLFFYPHDKHYYILVGSDKGKELVKDLDDAKKDIKLQIKNQKILEDKNIERNYKNKIWSSDVEKCLSCSACTVDCPTCNCFDIKDQLDINLKDGKRKRVHMSCQLKSFSKVAGGKVFRDLRESRFKHFIYHKIVYYKKHFKRYMCVGCGRCLRVCPTKIDWVNTINILRYSEKIKDQSSKQEKINEKGLAML